MKKILVVALAVALVTGAASPTFAAPVAAVSQQKDSIGVDTKVEPLKFGSKAWNKLPMEDRQLLTQLKTVKETFEKHARAIWSDNFRPDRTPMIFGNAPDVFELPTHALAINVKPAGGVKLDLPKELGFEVYRTVDEGVLEKIKSNGPFGFEWHEDGTTGPWLLSYGTGHSVTDPDTWIASRIHVHELFHSHQAVFKNLREHMEQGKYPRGPVEAHALSLVQDELLAKADTGQIDARDALTKWAALQEKRFALNPKLKDFDQTEEILEGSARYVEDEFVKAAGQTHNHATKPDSDKPIDLFWWLAGNRHYQYGAAAGRLLDKVTRSQDWRAEMENGKSFFDIARAELFKDTSIDVCVRTAMIAAQREYDLESKKAMIERADLPSLDIPIGDEASRPMRFSQRS
ncbi:hypothetical protein ACFVFQ_38700 [Streptomyces sp. NPDC057743]|uniref:hypothetical protein n=1 Tax=Streptomyces sp. NPDC057743 TaxID=3346236 RepID=UPI0036CEB54F